MRIPVYTRQVERDINRAPFLMWGTDVLDGNRTLQEFRLENEGDRCDVPNIEEHRKAVWLPSHPSFCP